MTFPRSLAAFAFSVALLLTTARGADDDTPSPAEHRAAVHWVEQEIEIARVLDAVAQRPVRGPVLYRDIAGSMSRSSARHARDPSLPAPAS